MTFDELEKVNKLVQAYRDAVAFDQRVRDAGSQVLLVVTTKGNGEHSIVLTKPEAHSISQRRVTEHIAALRQYGVVPPPEPVRDDSEKGT